MPAKLPGWGLLTRRSDPARTATELYGRLVAQARSPAFYAGMGVPDTPEGRFELLLLHMALMLRRLQREGQETAQLARALSETFVIDMDDCMREMGVGDLTVAKKVKKAAAALYDRSRDYGKALELADADLLAQLIASRPSNPTAPPSRRAPDRSPAMPARATAP
jgi:cytochrome b pre-mRNA-processing protein 3